MKTHLTKVSLALVAAAFLLGCQDQGSEPVGPEGVGPQFAEGGGLQFARKICEATGNPPPCPKDGDGGVDKTAEVEIDNPLLTPGPQTVNAKFTKNQIQLGNIIFRNELNLSALTGNPSVSVEVAENGDTISFTFEKLGNCTTDPGNMDTAFPAVLARLIGHLNDGEQDRRFFSKIDLKSVRDRLGNSLASPTSSKVHQIEHTWTDGNGRKYRTRLGTHGLRPEQIVIVKETGNVFEFTGGSWRSWETDTPLPGSPHGAFLVCDNTPGSKVTMTVTEL